MQVSVLLHATLCMAAAGYIWVALLLLPDFGEDKGFALKMQTNRNQVTTHLWLQALSTAAVDDTIALASCLS